MRGGSGCTEGSQTGMSPIPTTAHVSTACSTRSPGVCSEEATATARPAVH
jgi:hypothetical protein